MDRLLIKFLAVAVLCFAVLYSVFTYAAIHNQTRTCQQVEVLKAKLSDQVRNSNKRLPTIQYYRDHPDELKLAIRDNKKILDVLAPSQCRGLF